MGNIQNRDQIKWKKPESNTNVFVMAEQKEDISEDEREEIADISKRIKKIVSSKIDSSRDYSDEEIRGLIDIEINSFGRTTYLTVEKKLCIRKKIFNSMRGLDVLQDLVDDEEITEIMVNGPKKIFVEKKGRIEKSSVTFESEEKMNDIIQRITSSVNRTINEAHPIVDARLKDGSRVNVVLPPVSLCGPILTIRKFSRDVMSMKKLIEMGSLSEEVADLLSKLVAAGYNIICSGGTGSGKTTMLNALAEYIPRTERIITIEDSAELKLEKQPNLVSMEARNANVEGKNEIKIRDLIRTALRMRPDRIIVGEVRGRETIDMLQALNTGHTGMSTGHANSPRDMLLRLETMVLLDESIPLQAIRAQIASAIDIIIGVSRIRDGSRRVTSIYEIIGVHDGEIELNLLYYFEEDTEKSARDKVIGHFRRKNPLKNKEKLCLAGISL